MRRRRKTVLVPARLGGALLAVALCASTVRSSGGLPGEQTFRSSVSAVRLDVLVVEDGRPVAGLSSQDFEVFDNGVRQHVTAAYAERTPLDVIFTLDRSESVAGEELARLKGAVRAALEALREGDRAALLTFAHTMSLDAAMQADRAVVAAAVDRVEARGATAAIDAVHSALSMTGSSGRRTLVLLYSDGFDNSSWLTADDAVHAARESEAVICSVAYTPPRPGRQPVAQTLLPPNLELLRRLSEASGGEVLTTRSGTELAPTFVRILDMMRARYLLTYTPSAGETKGWHELKVRVTRRGAEVIVRPGYLVR